MEFIFVCPTANDTFQTDAFRIIENNGIKTDRAGAKHMDAKVQVDMACPFCGEKHIYRADELLCPFEVTQ